MGDFIRSFVLGTLYPWGVYRIGVHVDMSTLDGGMCGECNGVMIGQIIRNTCGVCRRVLDRVHAPYRARVRDRCCIHGHDSQKCRVLRGLVRGPGRDNILPHDAEHVQR